MLLRNILLEQPCFLPMISHNILINLIFGFLQEQPSFKLITSEFSQEIDVKEARFARENISHELNIWKFVFSSRLEISSG